MTASLASASSITSFAVASTSITGEETIYSRHMTFDEAFDAAKELVDTVPRSHQMAVKRMSETPRDGSDRKRSLVERLRSLDGNKMIALIAFIGMVIYIIVM